MADFKDKSINALSRAIAFTGGAGVSFVTAAGAITLTMASPHLLFLDPDGSNRNVTMPSTNGHGCTWIVVNTAGGAEDLVLKDPAGNTIITVSQNELGIVGTDGTTWDGAIVAIALT